MVILGSCGIWVQGTRAGGVVCTGRLCLLPPRGSAAQPGTHSELPSDWNSFVLLWKSEVPNREGGGLMGYLATSFVREKETTDVGIREGIRPSPGVASLSCLQVSAFCPFHTLW